MATANGAIWFEHYDHPCLDTNAASGNVSVSRFLLPFGLQGYELTVRLGIIAFVIVCVLSHKAPWRGNCAHKIPTCS